MDDLEMDCHELTEERPKRPIDIAMYESSGYHSATSPELNSTCSSVPRSSQMKSEMFVCPKILFTPDVACESQFTSPSSSLLRSAMLRSIDASPDSGIGCDSFNSLAKDSVIGDVYEEYHAPSISATKRTASSEDPQIDRIPHIPEELKQWQSTPVVPEASNLRATFECGSGFGPSPTKRRKYLSRRTSRDLFQSSRKKGPPVFPQHLPDFLATPVKNQIEQPVYVGRESVDFLFYLGKKSNYQPALDAIVSYLSPADLCRACIVSQTWKNIIESIPKACLRKQEYIDRCSQIKENLHQSSKKNEGILPIRGQLIAIQNFNRTDEGPCPSPRSPPVSPSKVRFNLFYKEGRKLENGQTLIQCPQCKLPSRKETERSAMCTRRGCQYHFCITCLCKFHDDKACPVSSVRHRKRPTAIGSRESKKNLQRLCK